MVYISLDIKISYINWEEYIGRVENERRPVYRENVSNLSKIGKESQIRVLYILYLLIKVTLACNMVF